MINVLVLMSGPSEAFKEAGFSYPKNFIELAGKPLVQRVLESLSQLTRIGARFFCVIQEKENLQFHTASVIGLLMPNAKTIEVRGTTRGAACSALLAIEEIGDGTPLIVVNGDQIITSDVCASVVDFQLRNLDGGVIVFEDLHPRWSFVKCDASGNVIEAAEKRPISKYATAGFYYFARGDEFVTGASAMLTKNAHFGGSFYVCPVYNELILLQKRIGISLIQRSDYYSLTTPAGVAAYESVLQQKLLNK
jgi:dTDP-glucose pyrophosphorylase